ncbi:hypothetical protein MAC_05486 [Metarhizium acridum CQMa 102]|uniref:Uncharacterized protein n=1 Tax=Metarhizium acridum (strain CQMa 102) TaxID=655827 RepID=E9E6I8_METAQ|nr:uncharacterized protein MAC_05486 [Metarhizium acridum CQMa 102]EFY88434.1 hypothetical protein MAC_05486 [Metarhizium acridum CQMa 102]
MLECFRHGAQGDPYWKSPNFLPFSTIHNHDSPALNTANYRQHSFVRHGFEHWSQDLDVPMCRLHTGPQPTAALTGFALSCVDSFPDDDSQSSSRTPPVMEDPTWAWPAWKFGMKRDDLFTSLHDQYNTFSFTLQDPEAFHHDVYEISRDAETTHEFHRMMADRRRMRLRELNESLETLAVEIIANPTLMATDQWQYALQLFRTKSYDSIIRYFASYLPEDYLDRHDTHSTSSASFSETDTISTAASSVDDAPCPFMADDYLFPDGPAMTTEPDAIEEKPHHNSHPQGPLSPPHSEDAQSEPSVSSPPSDAESNDYVTNPPSRSMSFSGSESGHLVPQLIRRRYLEKDFDEKSRSDECQTTVTSVCDSVESAGSIDVIDDQLHTAGDAVDFADEEEDIPTAQYPDDEFNCLDLTFSFAHPPSAYDTLDSDTPTPRPEAAAASYMEFRSVISHSRKAPSYPRSPSPKCCLANRGAGSPAREVRRSPEESLSKIQKPVQDFSRRHPKARRRMD